MTTFIVRLITFLSIFAWTKNSYAFDVKSVCSSIDKINQLIVPYKPQAWPGLATTPSGPVPTITFFVLNSREPLLDFCTFWLRLQLLTTEGKVFSTAQELNKMTGNQHTEKIGLFQDYYDLGVGVNTLGRGANKADSVMIHQRINRAIGSSQDFFGKGQQEPTFESKFARERNVKSMVRTATKLKTLKEFGSCREGAPVDPEALEHYEREIIPLYELLAEQNDEYEFALQQLQAMGLKIHAGYEDHKKYQRELLNAVTQGVFFRRSPPKAMKVPTYRGGGKEGMKKEMVDQIYYTYSIAESPNYFNILKQYETAWSNYSIAMLGSFNVLNNFRHNAESEFRDFSFECRRSKIEWKIRKNNPEFMTMDRHDSIFAKRIEDEVKSCKENSNFNADTAKTLFGAYVNHLRLSLLNRGRIQAKIWDYESRYKGNHINVSSNPITTDLGELAQERIECERAPNAGELNYARSQVKDVLHEINTMRLEEQMKKTTLLERRQRERLQKEDENRRRDEIMREMEWRKTYINDDLVVPDINNINF